MAPETSKNPASEQSGLEPTEPSVRRRRRRSRQAASNRNQRRWLRLAYFSLASLWGFLIGTASLLYGFSLGGRRLELSPVAIVTMSVAALAAVVGGMIASRAYREAARRQRP